MNMFRNAVVTVVITSMMTISAAAIDTWGQPAAPPALIAASDALKPAGVAWLSIGARTTVGDASLQVIDLFDDKKSKIGTMKVTRPTGKADEVTSELTLRDKHLQLHARGRVVEASVRGKVVYTLQAMSPPPAAADAYRPLTDVMQAVQAHVRASGR